jgi:transcriptional regulator with XRE-family HTH domain
MTATSEPAGGPVELARRLKALRRDRSIPQRTLADALGVSVALVSTWESETNPAAPPRSRIRDLATFYASERSWSGGRGKLLKDDELSPDERAYREQLAQELQSVVADPSRPTVLPISDQSRSTLWFPPGEDIRIVCGKLDDLETTGHPYTDPEDFNYTDLLTFADTDALIELFGFLRKVNPESDIRFIRSDRLLSAGSPDDLATHLILLGGIGLNVATDQILGRVALPIRQVPHSEWIGRGKHPEWIKHGEAFEITGERNSEQLLPAVQDGHVTEDVGLLVRAPNPYHSGRTLTICNGIFARGVLGAVRALTDDKIRRQNELYLRSRFADTDRFAILMRVPVLLGKAQTPDLQNARTRLYEWRGDAVPKTDSSGREKAG